MKGEGRHPRRPEFKASKGSLDEITYALTPLLILLPLTANTAELAAIWIQGQALFYDLRDLDSLSHRERIRILEQTADCIQQAHDRRAFR